MGSRWKREAKVVGDLVKHFGSTRPVGLGFGTPEQIRWLIELCANNPQAIAAAQSSIRDQGRVKRRLPSADEIEEARRLLIVDEILRS